MLCVPFNSTSISAGPGPAPACLMADNGGVILPGTDRWGWVETAPVERADCPVNTHPGIQKQTAADWYLSAHVVHRQGGHTPAPTHTHTHTWMHARAHRYLSTHTHVRTHTNMQAAHTHSWQIKANDSWPFSTVSLQTPLPVFHVWFQHIQVFLKTFNSIFSVAWTSVDKVCEKLNVSLFHTDTEDSK
jgi:hypothetical protein